MRAPADTMAACTRPLREALNEALSSGRFVDTKIILYSRRGSSGCITKPKALYANSHVLKSVPYFSHLLSGTYSESEPKDFSESIDEDEQAENYGHSSDSDLEDDDHVVNSMAKTPKKAAPPKSNSLGPSCLPASDKRPAPVYGEWKEPSGKGTIIKIHDVAFITFQAFLMYLYTGQIKFAPYGSEENRRSRSTEIVSTSEDSIPRPSPKSIYRLADMVYPLSFTTMGLG
ncbi:hypothetical protein BJ322DRAFT_827159 [Thelephora terrestris]|uniref:BTB domain-containing protein n=1 Tax=Thelephora terrestris TaxID=56493 RepID=A0A9P6HEI9_9AGAM|nr:hypothetical protein BJ322DRAFT_827159 [Thelephora terrestris]